MWGSESIGKSPYNSIKYLKISCLSILLVISLVSGVKRVVAPTTVLANAVSVSIPKVIPVLVSQKVELSLPQKVGLLYARISKDFSPHMAKVVQCESQYRQFDSDGTVLLSPTMDVGLFQINLKAHLKESQRMGLDIINSLEDNYKFAKWLFDSEGESPWVCAGLI